MFDACAYLVKEHARHIKVEHKNFIFCVVAIRNKSNSYDFFFQQANIRVRFDCFLANGRASEKVAVPE